MRWQRLDMALPGEERCNFLYLVMRQQISSAKKPKYCPLLAGVFEAYSCEAGSVEKLLLGKAVD